ncbi:peptidoglycan/LPS O-acetylase OafA/YrhL [Thioclava sp. ES.031]|uniref:acyltransferase family protein n=1 Tax=Thioclava sp. ES.031 TaxID=1798203 RepID=UPI000BF7DBB8|nr:acyltransferase family protein [Thioclava sp. ES.031]PFG63457.1 peptidoglycan/LPS O-acetylase OafA/YrhL [Thioclava sp. ES.031]
MKYRSEIDGLRAVAVISAILFHAGVPGAQAGFIGVDIFFVISGFLITTILVQDLQSDRYSILTFYERRARRILPALLVVILACLPFAWAWMFADQLRDFGQSIVGAALFVSNILFWKESGYFSLGSEMKPLMHTWSLAIEEQYYILFPPLLALGWHFGRKMIFGIVLAIGVLSLAIAQYWSFASPDAGFFLLPSRAWELMIGGLGAFWMLWRAPRANGWLGGAGALMLFASYFLFDAETPHPSFTTLLPVVGTLMILVFARQGTAVARVLSLRPVVGIGLISYSAYLWHQPVFAFARMRSLADPSLSLMLALSVLSLGLAYLSWRYVEQPFRSHRKGIVPLLPRRSVLLSASAAALVALIGVGATLHLIRGAPWRVPPQVATLLAAKDDINPLRDQCLPWAETPAEYNLPPDPVCVSDVNPGGPLAVLVGDSHADALAEPLRAALEGRGWRFAQVTTAYCGTAPGVHRGAQDCNDVFNKNMAYLREVRPDLIIASGRLQNLFSDDFFDNGEGGHEYPWRRPKQVLVASEIGVDPSITGPALAEAALHKGVEEFLSTGAYVLYVHPVPEAGWNVPEIAAKQSFLAGGGWPTVTVSRASYAARAGRAQAVLDAIDDPHLFHVRPQDIFCDATRCTNATGGKVYYHDDDHLSLTGARLVVGAVMAQFPTITAQMTKRVDLVLP